MSGAVPNPVMCLCERIGDDVEIDPSAGTVTVAGKEFSFPSLPAEMLEILEAGGLLAHIRTRATDCGGPEG